jgi:hypothetical protein
MLHFGEGLARLAADIGSQHGDRRAGAKARSKAVSGLHKDTHRMIAGFDDARSVMAAKTAKEARALRKQLVTSNRVLVGTVSERLAAIKRDRMAEHRALAKSAKVLRGELSGARKKLAADVDAFRANLSAERTDAAEMLRAGLADFVDRVRVETAGLLDAVKVQTTMARSAWNGEKAAKPAKPAKSAAPRRKAGAKSRKAR